MPADVAVRVRVTGRVQGVWFRGWTRAEAERLGLRGWVRNAADGSVELLVAGPEDKVAEMIAALHRGPEFARVVLVTTEPVDEAVAAGFRVMR